MCQQGSFFFTIYEPFPRENYFYTPVQFSAVQCSEVLYGAVLSSLVQFGAVKGSVQQIDLYSQIIRE